MYVNGIGWFQYKTLASSCLIVLLAQFILIVDSVKPEIASTNRQMCSKLQSMLSYGKYQTSQISSNITYASRIYAQNFLTYSSMDDLLIFIEPKSQIHVYNARTVQHIVNISTTDVVIATSCISLVSDSPHDLYFIYENNSETNLIFLRVCQVHFNIYKLNFDHNYCIETLKIQYDQPNLRIYGFTIKRDHAKTKKSLLFISTEIGLIYTIFDTRTGSLINVPLILNETLNEGSVVLSPLGSIYYASNQENLIYELFITRDFRLRYGKITKTNAIKSPFGLITDECNHLYIATRSMILIIYVQNSATIRSVFAKSSDLPITLERLNTTTYVYATIKKNTAKIPPDWMFNFLYFTQPEKTLPATRHPAVNLEENLDFNITADDSASIPILLPSSYSLLSMTNTSKIYTQFASTPRKPFARFRKNKSKYPKTTVSIDRERPSTDQYNLFTQQPPVQQWTPDIPDELQQTDLDYDFENTDDSQFDYQEQGNQSLDQEIQPETYLTEDTVSNPYSSSQNLSVTVKPLHHLQNDPNESEKSTLSHESRLTTSSIRQPSDSYFNSQYINPTVNPQQTLLSQIHPSYNFNTTGNLTYDAYQQLHDYLLKQPFLDWNSPNRTTYAEETIFSVDDLQSYLQGGGNLSKIQERQIQAYLDKQSSSNQNIFSQFFTSTNKPNKILLPGKNIQPDLQKERNHTNTEDTQLEDYSEELLPSDFNYFNHTIDSEAMLFTVDDLRSYVEGRGNLTNSQKAHIQAYLDRQSSSNQTLFSKYYKSTKSPTRKYTSDGNIHHDKDSKDPKLEEFLKKIPLTDSNYFNFSTDSEEILIPIEDLRSYLQGRGNLSKSQEAQIQAYLSKQSSSVQNIFSNYLTSTKIPRTSSIPGKNIQSQLEKQGNHSVIDDTQPEYYSEEVSPDDFEYYNRTKDSEERLFTVDDLRSYLQGRANLSLTQEAQIQAYLARQASSNQTIFSKYSKSTRSPTRKYTSDHNLDRDDDSEKIKLDDFLKKIPLTDSNYFNFSTDSEEILIPIDDLRSYFQGRGNLSKSQEAQIQAYLSKQSSSDQNNFSNYLASTKIPRTPSIPGRNVQSQLEKQGNHSVTDDTQPEYYSEEVSPDDFEYYNRTKDSEERLFTVDDLRSYLQGRANLSLTQAAQIQAYLARQSSSNQTIFFKHLKSTKSPMRKYTSDDNLHHDNDSQETKLDDFLKKIPLTDSNYFNFSTASEEILIPTNDFRSFLQGRGNLSKSQEAQIRAYLSKQSSSDQNIFSRYSRSTQSPARIYTSDDDLHLDDESDDRKFDDFLKKIPRIDSNYLNISTDSEEILIPIDDLRSYFQGRGNLSKSQEAQIEVYLARQSSSDQNIFSKHLTSTKKPSEPLTDGKNVQFPFQRDGNLSLTEDSSTEIDAEELLPSYINYFNHTIHPEGMLFSVDELRSYLKGRANLTNSQTSQIESFLGRQSLLNQTVFSKYTKTTTLPTTIYTSDENKHRDKESEDIMLEEFVKNILLINSKYFNFSTDSEEIIIPMDDLRSFLRGEGNLSLAQEKKIQAYLAQQSSSSHNTFSKYSTSTKIPTTFTPTMNILSQIQTEENLSLTKHTPTDIYPEELLPSDFKYFNYTTDSEETLFTVDDLRSYLRGRGNLTNDQKTKIQAYLARQSSFNETLFSNYSTSTKQPARIHTSEDDLHLNDASDDAKLEEFLKKIPLTDSKYFNFSTDSEEILIPIDGLRSYLQGRGNLSKSQEAQIQAYLSKQSSSDQNIFSNFLTSTKIPRTPSIPGKNIQSQLEKQGNHSVTDDTQPEYYSEEVLPDDFEYYNRTTDSEERLFTLEDLRSYLQGRANLSLTQEAQIQAYLARQASSNQTIFSKYAKSTKSPTRKYTSDHNLDRDKDSEDLKVDDFLKNIPLTDSNYFNFSTDSEEILIPIDDLRSFLQGRGNLSKSQEAQIQAYLSKQSSSDHNIFSKYLTSTKIPRTSSIPGKNIQSQLEKQGNHSVIDDTQPEYYSEEVLSDDFEYYNRTNGSGERLFTVDDLRSYLQGRANLSETQEAQIQAYLARQSASNQTIFSKYSKSTKSPTRKYTSDENLFRDKDSEDPKFDDFLKNIPLTDSNYFNFSTDSEEILIPIEDLRSYLQGRGNLSKSQEAQIQAYLSKQSSSDQNIFSKYLTSTKIPRTPSIPGKNIDSQFEREGNHSFIDDTQPEYYSEEVLPDDFEYFNRTNHSEERLFSVDDLRSYLEGRANLSLTQAAQIQAYLARQGSSNQTIFSKYPKSTKSPTRKYTSDDNLHRDDDSQETKLDDLLKKIPLMDSNYFNFSVGSEERLFTVDDFRSYLQGRGNLSLTQEAQIEAYLARQSFSNQSLFSKYSKSTKQPARMYTSDEDSQRDDKSEDTKLEEFLEKIPLTDSKYFNFSTDSEEILIPIDDLRSYLQGRTNLSKSHEAQIQAYLTKQISSGNNTLPRYVNVSSIPHLSSPSFVMSNTTVSSSYRSRLSSPFPGSPVRSSTRSSKSTRLSSPKRFSEINSKITTMPSYPTGFSPLTITLESSHQFSSMRTMNAAMSSDISKQKSSTTHSDLSSSAPLATQHPRFTSSFSSTLSPISMEQSLTTKFDQYRAKLPETHIQLSSSSYTVDKTDFGLTNYRPLETTEKLQLSSTLSSSVKDRNRDGYISDQSPFDWTSTIFPHFYQEKTLSTLKQSTFDLPHPSTTTILRYRSRKQKIIRWRTQEPSTTSSSSTTTIIPLYQTTSIHDPKSSTSTQISIWHSEWNPLEEQQTIIIKPPLTLNDSNTLLSNDLLNKILNNISTSTNSSREKFIHFNLIDHPPSSWNLSLISNESIILDVTLPSSNSTGKTNLTFTHIEANRFSTNIIGRPVNLQIDRVYTKEFSLKMNSTDDDKNSNHSVQYLSDVIIGHVKSEQFELNLTKSNNMHVHVQQVDSATAELYLDSQFCTNESSLEINFNLSKNGIIRYGNRPAIYIGPVFTRVYMLKQSCDREQPLILFFDICQRQNPCSHGGICVSLIPDYNDASYSDTEIGHVGYRCNCPLNTFGEHCQYFKYPLGYCLNGGALFQIYDRFNRSIQKCICSIGFQGEYCEENIDNCIGIRCSNHGICQDGIQTYQCSCFDGFYGLNCERTRVKTVILQVTSRSFGIIAILLIAAIACLVVASDIHTYVTRKQQRNSLLNKIPRATSEGLENSVLLLGFSDAPIEMNDSSFVGRRRKAVRFKQRYMKRTTRNRKPTGYRRILRTRPLTTFPKTSSGRYLISSQPN